MSGSSSFNPIALEEFRRQVKVLVVDDEESLRGMLTETISEHGMVVHSAESGEQALEKFKERQYNIVLSDIRMAGISGIDLIKAIKANFPDTEVIIMTSHASMDTAISAIRAGAYDYLLKPFENLEDVAAIINRVIDKLFLIHENQRLIKDLQTSNSKLVEKNKETQTLYNFSKFLTQTLDMNEVMKLSMSCFSQLGGGYPTIFIAYLQGKLVVTASHPEEHAKAQNMKALVSLENMKLEDIMAWFHRINQDDVFKKTLSLHFHTDSYFAAPLFVSNKPFGILVSLGPDGQEYPQQHSRLLNQFSQMVAVAIDNAYLHKQMQDYAIKDGLTGLFNHRYFQERLSSEIARAERHNHNCCLIFIDVDHFKKFNDTNGHPMGDMVLKGVASILAAKSRKTDIVARYGGEEFVVILPETPKEGAITMAEELRKTIEQNKFPCGETQPLGHVSVSLGVAAFPMDALDVKGLITSADNALYHSKEGGRNRVTGFDRAVHGGAPSKKGEKVQAAPAPTPGPERSH